MGKEGWIAAGAVALVGLSPMAPAGGTAIPSSEPVVSHVLPSGKAHRDKVLRYWTADRMTGAVSPVAPRPGPLGKAEPPGRSNGAVWPLDGGVVPSVGKVFFTLDGRDYLCSGAAVRSASRDLVVTAGHCARGASGRWAENWIFVPGYREGGGPQGGFPARLMAVPDQWASKADDDYDVAMVALHQRRGKHVADLVGANTIAFGRPRGRPVHAFGYPSQGRYDGERLAYCAGTPEPDPHRATVAQGLHCDLTQGSSGGPWLIGFDPATGTGTVTSVSSFKYADDKVTMYGPYFGQAIRELYARTERV
ncbi:trypsin-like peptidase domain-containing protein [Actinocorallia sp. API 0066]|uniref:trypsin-like serine peptidase n=1 Tax=Actinocorallia sp. API 0066 TaxID=2896846 RepID=UPI001E53345C|nr:trypsin-like peptidase domain-containing protein [Actinocorallia sp. API 0066]MCD0448468.1 trypsin-like peptidase domain-containing protein [Actinocorallia sp. API 0066]